MTSSLQYVPARMSLMNVSTADVLNVQFNPTELDEELTVNWNKLAVLGLSHMPLQYQQTDNHGFSFELAGRAVDDTGNRLADTQYARRFLLSLCYAPRNTGSRAGIVGGSPPRVLFVWPTLAELTCVIKKLHFHHSMFNRKLNSVDFSCKVDLEEIRDFRLYSEDVLAMGTQRAGQVAPGQAVGGANDGTSSLGNPGY